jgi:hypothetical protein
MALADLQAFLVQTLTNFDPTIDTTPGSPADVQVIQPVLQRLGTDPYTVDIGLFIQTTLNQQFPDMPTKEGDAITDLLIKAGIVLWNPLVRENTRIANSLSFANPDTLTSDEAQALGANLFAPIETGKFATGVARIYFASPQSIGVTPANFCTSQEGFHFFPTQSQSIRVDEMLLNLEGTLYYFDINLIAEAAGDQYNIAIDDLVTIANVASATRITNKVAFSNGLPAETVIDYVSRIEQALTERSLVTARGIIFQVQSTLTEVTSCFPIGFNDPEMKRDIITGGGLGPILAGGNLMSTTSDGANAILTRRVVSADPGVDFTQLIGPTGTAPTGFVLTVFNAYPVASLPTVRDLTVLTVIDPHTLDLAEQVLSYVNLPENFQWTLRMNSLTLSGIPGGILFPNTPYGTITMPSGEIHIGGCTDVYVAGAAFDAEVLTLNNIVDDDPVLEGVSLDANLSGDAYPNTSYVQLLDYVLAPGSGANYSVGDPTYTALENAEANGLSIQILDPPNAGAYRILSVTQAAGVSPILLITPPIQQVTGAYRWRISDDIFIDLLNPKQTKVSGSDLSTVLGQAIVTTASGTDFADYGVAEGDILQLLNGGLVMANYTVQSVQPPFYNELIVDRPMAASVNDVSYIIYTPNADGGMTMPFVRINQIDLLDTSGQPVGTTIPYAKPVDCQTNGFASIGSGIKADVSDGILGLVSIPFAEVGVTKGSADITAPSLYGLTGTLASTTLILNVNGAGAVTLDLLGLTNAANEAALLSSIQSTWPALSVIVLGDNLVLHSSGGIVVGAGTANIPLGLTVGSGTVPTPALDLNGLTLNLTTAGGTELVTVTFTSTLLTPDGVAEQINAAVAAVTTPSIVRSAVSLGADVNNNANRIGLLPVFPGLMITSGTALLPLFGHAAGIFTTRDITSSTVQAAGGWAALRPALDASYDVAQALDGTQLGFFQLSAYVVGDTFDPVPNTPFNNTAFDPLRTLHDFNPEVGRHIQVGARSLGTVVLYFIDPTSFEVDGDSFFTFTGSDGSVLNYFPDPTQKYQTIPAQPSGTKPLDGTTGLGTFLFESLSTNFVTQGVQYGDELVIDFTAITGTVNLTDPVSNLNTKTLTLSLGGGPDKTVIFINDSSAIAPTDVTRAGVATQINNAVGLTIVSLNASNQLVFNPTSSLIIRGAVGVTTSGPGPANLILGFSNVVGIDQNNDATDEGTYTVIGIAPDGNVNQLQVMGNPGETDFPSNPGGISGEQFSIVRPGVQRIVSTTMATNVADGGLYSFEVQLVSQGTGSQYNIGANIQLTVDGYSSDGYYLTTDDPNLSFSPVERPKLILSTSILAPGVSDNPSNATFLAGQNLQINYDQSSTVQDTNNFITADTERVICASPLARHLTPYFVRLTLVYFGGSTADLVTSDIEAFIAAIAPNGQLNVSDIENICANRNATSVQNPIDLIAIIHNIDRSLSTERSQNFLNTGRLAAFFSDVLQVSRNITGSGN